MRIAQSDIFGETYIRDGSLLFISLFIVSLSVKCWTFENRMHICTRVSNKRKRFFSRSPVAHSNATFCMGLGREKSVLAAIDLFACTFYFTGGVMWEWVLYCMLQKWSDSIVFFVSALASTSKLNFLRCTVFQRSTSFRSFANFSAPPVAFMFARSCSFIDKTRCSASIAPASPIFCSSWIAWAGLNSNLIPSTILLTAANISSHCCHMTFSSREFMWLMQFLDKKCSLTIFSGKFSYCRLCYVEVDRCEISEHVRCEEHIFKYLVSERKKSYFFKKKFFWPLVCF